MADFQYYNNNIYGYTDEDCVTRAITLATGEDYLSVQKKIDLVGELLECEPLCVGCYQFLINKVYGFPEVKFHKGITVGEFAQQHEQGIYLIRIAGHITTLVDGRLLDLWDASEKFPTNIWFCGW